MSLNHKNNYLCMGDVDARRVQYSSVCVTSQDPDFFPGIDVGYTSLAFAPKLWKCKQGQSQLQNLIMTMILPPKSSLMLRGC
jgi:hypothetical protein